jgi:hypothetical protein
MSTQGLMSIALVHIAAMWCVSQVTILGRHEADELLLLASDGLWDVLSNQEACR